MSVIEAYREVISFIAVGSSPAAVAAFRPFQTGRARAADLLTRGKSGGMRADEAVELDDALQLEHLVRLTKADVHQFLAGR